MGLQTLLYVALGGAVGAVLRVGLVTLIASRFPTGFPWGTLSVNVLGSFLIGVCAIALNFRYPESHLLRYGFIAGVLGSFTTFSAFSMETINLFLNGSIFNSVMNVTANVVLCLCAAGLGVWLAKSGLSGL